MNQLLDFDCRDTKLLPPGTTLREALEKSVPVHLLNQPGLIVLNRGVEVKRESWDMICLNEHDRILVGILPQGGGGDGKGKSIGAIIVGIVLIVVGVIFEMPTLIQMGAGLLLGGVAGLLIKPPSLGTQNRNDNDRESSSYSIGGQSNAARPYQPVMKVYGRYKVFPSIAATPIVSNVGIESRISTLYDFGIGWVTVEDIRIGDTDVGQFAPELRLHQNTKTPALELCNRGVTYDQFSYVLQHNVPLTFRTSINTWLAELDIAFNQGLVQFDKEGTPVSTAVPFDAVWREYGTSAWNPITHDMVRGMPALPRAEIVGWGTQTFIGQGWVEQIDRWTMDGNPPTLHDIYNWNGQTVGESAPGAGFSPPNGTYGYDNITLSRGPQIDIYRWQLLVTADGAIYDNVTGFVIEDVTTRPKVASIYLQFPKVGQFELMITRLSPISTDTKLFNTAAISMLKSSIAGTMLALEQPHTVLEMRLIASEKVSGVIQNLSAIATSVLAHYAPDGAITGWHPTRNPAWCALDVLIGSANPKPLDPGSIDWPSWHALAVYCDEQRTWNINGTTVTAARHTCDLVVDYKATVKEVLESILACCRANVVITQTGKYGVAIDQTKSVPRQLITPSNSWDFGSSRTFTEDVHGLRVTFVDNTREYQKQEIIVFRDGYDSSNSTKYEELGTFGITDWYRAWAFGRYFMAQVIHRAELFEVKMDVENLAFQRGDLVYVQHDVPKVGGYNTRVVSVSGNNVEVGQELSTIPTAYTVRLSSGSIRQGVVVAAIDSTTFVLDDASGIGPDDLIVLGIADRVTAPYLVQSIQPENDFSALITLSVYEPLIYDADIGLLPPWDPNWGDDLINATNLAVVTATATARIIYIDRKPVEVIDIVFTVNSPFYGHADIWWEVPNQKPELVDQTTTLQGNHEFSLVASRAMNYETLTYTITPFTDSGLQGQSGSVTVTVLQDPPPKAPYFFDLDLKRDTITLFWAHPDEPDILGYEVRYDPEIQYSTFSGSTLLTSLIPWPATSFEVPARLGTYYIKTIDTTGKRSPDYAVAFTPGENLWNLNVITVIDDDPENWPGHRVQFDLLSVPTWVGQFSPLSFSSSIFSTKHAVFNTTDRGLISHEEPKGVYPWRSEYYYAEMFDAGQIYQTRFTSKISAHPFNETSFMAAWVPLEIAQPIGGWSLIGGQPISVGDYMNVWHEIRWVNSNSTMVDWNPLADVVPIGYGESDFGPWRHFQVGDYIGQLFQFRLIAEYIGPNDPPDAGVIIPDAWIEVDMPDRMDGEYNILCPEGGLRVVYAPAFKARPAVAITPDIVYVGEQYRLTNSDRNGFDLQFLDAAGTPIARNFDWLAKGYGAESTRIIRGSYSAPAKGYRGRKFYQTSALGD